MLTVRFDLHDLRRIVAHAQASPTQREYVGAPLGPRLMLRRHGQRPSRLVQPASDQHPRGLVVNPTLEDQP